MPSVVLTEGSAGLAGALEGIVPFIEKSFSFMTQEPMIYFIAAGLVSAGIGLFAKAKASAH